MARRDDGLDRFDHPLAIGIRDRQRWQKLYRVTAGAGTL